MDKSLAYVTNFTVSSTGDNALNKNGERLINALSPTRRCIEIKGNVNGIMISYSVFGRIHTYFFCIGW